MSRNALAAGVLAFVLTGCWGGGSSAPSATPTAGVPASPEATATGAPPATPSPSSADYFDAKPLRAGPPVSLPGGVIIYSRDAIWEGAGGSIRRWYTEPSGGLRVDELFESTTGTPIRALITRKSSPTRPGGLRFAMDPVTAKQSR